MPWTASVTIYTEDVRMDNPEVIYRRPKGTIMGVNIPARKGGYGPNTPYGLLDVTGIPDRVSLPRLQNFLLQEWRALDVRVIIQWRDHSVIFDDLPTSAKNALGRVNTKRATVTMTEFLAAVQWKRNSRRLQEADL